MTTQHTPEPLKLAAGDPSFIQVYGVVKPINCGSQGLARRIVACVNACAGIDTAQLEAEAGKLFPQPRLLTAQRDELADALRDIVASCQAWAPNIDRSRGRAALAKLK